MVMMPLFASNLVSHDPLARRAEIAGIALNTNPPPAGVFRCNSGRPASHAVVHDRVAFVGIGPDQVFEQGDGFLCWVNGAASSDLAL